MLKRVLLYLSPLALLWGLAYLNAQVLPGDVTTSIQGGALRIQEIDGAPTGVFTTLKFSNGAVTDNGDGTVTVITGAGGGGDFSSNTATSVDSEIVLFSGTGGKTGKRATTTGILKGTSGVLSAAVAATDYVAPATTITVAGTTDEIASSAGAQSLAANRTWTLSLPSTLNLSSKTLRIPNSTTLPATCTVGDSYMDTDATTGQRFYLCESTNTWAVQGGAGGGGDFSSNTSTSVDNEIVLFSGTGGKTGKRATTTGILKATSGVLTSAVSGTDYAPATTTLTKNLPVTGVKLPTTDPARIDRSENWDRLLFDAATSQCAIWQFFWPTDYTSGGVLKVNYAMESATTGGVSIDVAVMAVTPGDAADGNTDSYDTVNNCDDAAVPGTAGFVDQISCTLTNKDSVAAADMVRLKLCRAVADSSDTATGNMEVLGVELSYVH